MSQKDNQNKRPKKKSKKEKSVIKMAPGQKNIVVSNVSHTSGCGGTSYYSAAAGAGAAGAAGAGAAGAAGAGAAGAGGAAAGALTLALVLLMLALALTLVQMGIVTKMQFHMRIKIMKSLMDMWQMFLYPQNQVLYIHVLIIK